MPFEQGLNFSVHADAAWGGYFCSMLQRDQPKNDNMQTAEETGFVPEMYLSSYVHEQLSALSQSDTIPSILTSLVSVPIPVGHCVTEMEG